MGCAPQLGLNALADKTHDEYKQHMLGYRCAVLSAAVHGSSCAVSGVT